MTEVLSDNADLDRNTKTSLLRGWMRKCPSCGEGAMMNGYLDVTRACKTCDEELYHHRADDGPAWATILLTGHLMAPMMLFVFETFRPEGWVMALTFSIFFIALSLYLLPRLKGAFVGLQWAKRMHGFGNTDKNAPGV